MAGIFDGYVRHRLVPLRIAVDGCNVVVHVAYHRAANANLQGVHWPEPDARVWYFSGCADSIYLPEDVALLGDGYVADGGAVGGALYDTQHLQQGPYRYHHAGHHYARVANVARVRSCRELLASFL